VVVSAVAFSRSPQRCNPVSSQALGCSRQVGSREKRALLPRTRAATAAYPQSLLPRPRNQNHVPFVCTSRLGIWPRERVPQRSANDIMSRPVSGEGRGRGMWCEKDCLLVEGRKGGQREKHAGQKGKNTLQKRPSYSFASIKGLLTSHNRSLLQKKVSFAKNVTRGRTRRWGNSF